MACCPVKDCESGTACDDCDIPWTKDGSSAVGVGAVLTLWVGRSPGLCRANAWGTLNLQIHIEHDISNSY